MNARPTPVCDSALALKMREAIAAFQRDNADEADTLCRSLLQARESYAPALGLAGMIAAQRGRLEEAEEHFQRVLQQRPAETNALFHYAGVALRQKSPAKALAAYDRALLLSPQDAQLHMDHANLL